MLLLVGLGNPGPRYAKNRHNIGFMALDAIAQRHGFLPWRKRFQGELAEGSIAGRKVIALKPLTYMNESGRSVGAAAHFYKIPPADILVFHDELDLAPGKVKIKLGGGAAGHNGLRSLDAHLGPDFKRIRLGIGHPGVKDRVHGHVLGDFSKADHDWLESLLAALASETADLLDNSPQGDSRFLSKVNQALFPPRANKAPVDRPARADKTAAGKTPEQASPPGDAAPPSTQARPDQPDGLLAQALKAARDKLGGKKKESDS
jgi:PTH1 family peptidyl-tRNA hydrolase|tara:strand:- start:1363 stop:2145 length:783 start_codon:yes stop_codon:yes gene_type:complete